MRAKIKKKSGLSIKLCYKQNFLCVKLIVNISNNFMKIKLLVGTRIYLMKVRSNRAGGGAWCGDHKLLGLIRRLQ